MAGFLSADIKPPHPCRKAGEQSKGRPGPTTRGMRGPTHSGCRERWQASKKPSLGTGLASTLILDLPAFKTRRNKSLLFKLPSLWSFVTAALVATDSSIFCSITHYRLSNPGCFQWTDSHPFPQEAHHRQMAPAAVSTEATLHTPLSPLMDPSTHQGVHCATAIRSHLFWAKHS